MNANRGNVLTVLLDCGVWGCGDLLVSEGQVSE